MDIAVKCHAEGIHVGQDDMKASCVRERVGDDMIIGVSAHTVEEAVEAVKTVPTIWERARFSDPRQSKMQAQ